MGPPGPEPKSIAAGVRTGCGAAAAVPVSAASMRPEGVFTQTLRRPDRAPTSTGLKRTRTVQLSPAASGVATEHVPPGATQKSLGFALDDAMPRRQKLRGP